jgi:hypothetical protein
MSALRYSGALTIRVTYLEPWGAGTPPPAGRTTNSNGEYRCFLRGPKGKITVYVGAVIVGGSGIGVDSPEAFDDAAGAAISFADDEQVGNWREQASYNIDGNGYHIARHASARFAPRHVESTEEKIARVRDEAMARS